ncbi:hypothetical protein HK103_005347 [Boothiomyces macroporosus]|uniref:Protein Zds1 C-terminal domain-containing protein n=1 Tax=Boothiomyces macroporosus TaxID=261099 RepID=A0AAD5UNN2_9FUNG|nr:hypothetical protein HK103_005347 [Boothiomyces macroporosus]
MSDKEQDRKQAMYQQNSRTSSSLSTFYQQPTMSQSSPAISTLSKKTSKFFGMFQNEDKEKSLFKSLKKRSFFFGKRKESSEPDIRALDFQQSSKVAEIRNWDSLTLDEIAKDVRSSIDERTYPRDIYANRTGSLDISRMSTQTFDSKESTIENLKKEASDPALQIPVRSTLDPKYSTLSEGVKEETAETATSPFSLKSPTTSAPSLSRRAAAKKKNVRPESFTSGQKAEHFLPPKIEISGFDIDLLKDLQLHTVHDKTGPSNTQPDEPKIQKSPVLKRMHTTPARASVSFSSEFDVDISKDLKRHPSLERKSDGLAVSPSRNSLPRFLTLDSFENPVDPHEDLFDMKKWLLTTDQKDEEEVIPVPSLTRRKSASRPTKFSDSHVNITPTSENLPDIAEKEDIPNIEFEFPDIQQKKLAVPTELKTIKTVGKVDAAEISGPVEETIPVMSESYDGASQNIDLTLREFNKERFSLPTSQEPPVQWAQIPQKQPKSPWSWITKFIPKLKPKIIESESEWNPYPDWSHLPNNRLDPEKEKFVYSLSHIKLAQIGRPLLQQVQISNLMLYILSVHSDVTIRGRGPRRSRRKQKRRKPIQPLIDFGEKKKKPVKNADSDSSESSSDEEDDDDEPRKPVKHVVPGRHIESEEDDSDEEDDVPLGMLQVKKE